MPHWPLFQVSVLLLRRSAYVVHPSSTPSSLPLSANAPACPSLDRAHGLHFRSLQYTCNISPLVRPCMLCALSAMYGDGADFCPVYTYLSCTPEVPVRATPSSPSPSRFPQPTGPSPPSLPVVLLRPPAGPGSTSALVFAPEQHGPYHRPSGLGGAPPSPCRHPSCHTQGQTSHAAVQVAILPAPCAQLSILASYLWYCAAPFLRSFAPSARPSAVPHWPLFQVSVLLLRRSASGPRAIHSLSHGHGQLTRKFGRKLRDVTVNGPARKLAKKLSCWAVDRYIPQLSTKLPC